MSSCEHYRTRAYHEDIRWRIIWQCEGLKYTHKQVAENLNIDKSTVSRILHRFHTTGSISKDEYPKQQAFRRLTTPAQILILTLIVKKPGVYLREIKKELQEILLLDVDISTICKFLHSNGCTRQKLCLVAEQRDKQLRQQYMMDISLYKPEMFIFLDETGTDQKDSIRRYGYSLRGYPIRKQALLVRGERSSAIALMSTEGILDVHITKGTTNGNTFYEFIQRNLLPHVQPFNGTNPHSVIVMDNCSIHHVYECVQIIEDTGAMLHFLPPYSPDLNPIEMAFSKVKSGIRDLESSLDSDIDTTILTAFTSVTAYDCKQWITHSLYNVIMN